ncbi:amino acid permease [Candidatus Woesearchaeota archaeon]|nr:amino acid permease [Candidatus Woesearchaeota archaeon]
MAKTSIKKYNTFSGVFIPTFLTIIGVILYLRLGYVVGNAGILGTLLIILISVSITFCTALSISSIITEIKVGPGGAYSIIYKTLGKDIAGSVGIPFYFAQAFSVAFYVFGFSEAWTYIFPNHPFLLVLIITFILLFLLTYITTSFAIKTQIIIFIIILLSIASVFLGNGLWFTKELSVPLFGNFQEMNFWSVFALFFPAVTGILAGIGLSGVLKNPKKQIRRGVLSAIGITTLIYIAVAVWFGFSASADQLIENTRIMIGLSAFGPLVLLGLLSATFSSALVSFVAAPRLLRALANHKLIPFSSYFRKTTKKGEPRIANLFTSLIIITTFTLGSLNIIAPILTVLFLIIYIVINLAILIKQTRESFKPTFKIPRIIPLYGVISSVIIIFLISVVSGIIALVSISLIYIILAGINDTR